MDTDRDLPPSQGEEREGARKEFSEELYETHDASGKFAVASYFGRKGYKTEIDPYGQYGVDVRATDPDTSEQYHIEVEVRPECWSLTPDGLEWKYPTVHFLERKTKYLDLDNFYLFAVSPDLERAVVVPGDVVRKSPKVDVPNKHVDRGELMYDVPLGDCGTRML